MLSSREFLFLSNPFHPNYDIEASILAHLKFQYNTDLFLMNEEYINSKTLINPSKPITLRFCSGGRTRTYDLVVNSHSLCQLSYAGIFFYLINFYLTLKLEPTSRPVGITATRSAN